MRWTVVICALMLAACSSADSPLVSFKDSGCKKGETEALTAGLTSSGHALLTVDSADLNGLTCFSWDATGTALKIDCINFGGGCGIKWTGDAATADGNSVTLFANHEPEDFGGEIGSSCAQAACGSCIYDWSFEVKGVDASKDCPVSLVKGGSCSSRTDTYTTTLPLAAKKNGIICRYTSYGLLEWGLTAGGTLHMPCKPTEDDHIPMCGEGLACTKTDEFQSDDAHICLKPCAADTDCPLEGLLRCEEGLCKLKETW